MLIGIEFKRAKVEIPNENRAVWFWRVAPYVRDVNTTKLGALVFFICAMGIIILIGENIK